MKPKVSIGVCVRNSAITLPEMIKSIKCQDYSHDWMEIIFIDDGSTDDTLSIIKDHVSILGIPARVFHTSWRGLGHARNMVVDNAEGEYILWVDGDMVLSKCFLRKLVEFMEKNPEVGIAKGKQCLDSGGNLLATLESHSRAVGRMVDYDSESAQSKSLGTGGSIYRTEAIRQAGGFDGNLRGYGEDFDMEIRVKTVGWKLRVVDVDFLDYERRGLTWKKLWQRYWLRGYYTHYFLHKNRGLLKHYRMLPPVAFVTGLLHAHKLFSLTKQRTIFLLPLEYLLKMSAWYIGFVRSHSDSYEPR